jgi:hypothetical protein
MAIVNKPTTSVTKVDAHSYCMYIEVKQLVIELGKGSLKQQGPEIGVEKVQPMQVSSVLFEKVPSSRLESSTQEGLRNVES